MKPMNPDAAANHRRTAELNDADPEQTIIFAQMTSQMAKISLRGVIDLAAEHGISDMTIVNGVLQYAACYMRDIHPGAAINMLRLMADSFEAVLANDRVRQVATIEALQLNGLTFTAALRAETAGGRN